MTDEDCPECGGTDPRHCSWCGGEHEVADLFCPECNEYLDDDGSCPRCDTESRGRNISRQDEQRRLRKKLGLKE